MRGLTISSLSILASFGAAASAAPPPPPAYPSGLPAEVDGYDMESIYAVYFSWLNRNREPAISAAVVSPREWKGLHLWSRPVESRVVSYDYNVVRSDKLDRYCEGRSWMNQPAGRCEYRYSYALIPGSPWSDPAVVRAIADSFKPAELARRLKAIKWRQGKDVWSDEELLSVFASHTDDQALFAPLVRTVEISSSTCPALATAIGNLGKVTLDFAPPAVIDPIDAMAPHGSRTEAQVTVADASGNALVVSAATPLHGILRPIWNAVEGCASGTHG